MSKLRKYKHISNYFGTVMSCYLHWLGDINRKIGRHEPNFHPGMRNQKKNSKCYKTEKKLSEEYSKLLPKCKHNIQIQIWAG